jgi:hypothetical protein
MRREATIGLRSAILLAVAVSAVSAAESLVAKAGADRVVYGNAGPLLLAECHRGANDYGQGPGLDNDYEGDDSNHAHGHDDGHGHGPDAGPRPCEHEWRP